VPPPIRRLPLEDAPAPKQAPPSVGVGANGGAPSAPSGLTGARRSIGAPQFSIRRMEVDNLSVSYAEREAVKSVSLPIRQGEVLALTRKTVC
jgi:ABC-type multidrug transport system fused ATPase/permease subunit